MGQLVAVFFAEALIVCPPPDGTSAQLPRAQTELGSVKLKKRPMAAMNNEADILKFIQPPPGLGKLRTKTRRDGLYHNYYKGQANT
jgi:hypothetical protein